MTNLQKQNLSHTALSDIQSLNEISGVQVHFDTMTAGNPSQFLTSYRLIANGATQSMMYNGSATDTTVYISISGVITGSNQAQLVSGDLQTLQGTMNTTSIVQTIKSDSFNTLPNYQQINLKSGYGIKLSLYDGTGQGDYVDVDVCVNKNPDKPAAVVQPNLKNMILPPPPTNDTNSGSNFFLIFFILILVLCVVGGGGYYYMKKKM
jgi:hypothetical protein